MSDVKEVLERIPMLDLRPEIEEQWDELMEAIRRVLRSGHFILGPEVVAFEHEVADYLGVKHAIGVNSGTDALVISLRALGIGPGDEVITTPFTFFATAESISNVGATPVFVDIDPATFNIDPELIEPAITERTKAIMPVHLFGLPCDMDPILATARKHGLKVIEDNAQAMGASYKGKKTGAFGDAAALSFFPSKNLGGFGDGGMVVTNNDEVAEMSRMLRTHGSKRKYENEMFGYNSRLDELQAAILRTRLSRLDLWNHERRVRASRYDELLINIEAVNLPRVPEHRVHVYHQYTLVIQERSRAQLIVRLRQLDVASAVYYPTPCNELPVYGRGSLASPSARLVADHCISLPISPRLPHRSQAAITDAVIHGIRDDAR